MNDQMKQRLEDRIKVTNTPELQVLLCDCRTLIEELEHLLEFAKDREINLKRDLLESAHRESQLEQRLQKAEAFIRFVADECEDKHVCKLARKKLLTMNTSIDTPNE